MTSRLDSLWSRIEGDGSTAAGWRRLRVPDMPDVPLYVAVNSETGLDGLVLEIPTRSIDPTALSQRTRGLEVTTRPLIPGRGGQTRVILGLAEHAFRDVFRALCADLADSLFGLTDPDQAAQEFSRRLKRWHRFLQAHGAGGLSDHERLGLMGELVVLRGILVNAPDPVIPVNAWTGPDNEARDLALPGGDLEVKTTRSQAPVELRVSSLGQLDVHVGRPLFIVHLIIVPNPTVGPTLPACVAEVAGLCGEAVGLFRERLHTAGYLNEHEGLYSSPRYQVLSQTAYEVGQDFPRLVSGNVPAAVMKATYSVSLSAIERYRLDDFHPSGLLEHHPRAT